MKTALTAQFNKKAFFTGLKNNFNAVTSLTGKDILKAAPSFILGAGVTMGIKSACAGAVCAAAPAGLALVFGVVASGAAAGAGITLFKGTKAHHANRKKQKLNGEKLAGFFSRKNFGNLGHEVKKAFSWKTMAIQVTSASLGGLSLPILEGFQNTLETTEKTIEPKEILGDIPPPIEEDPLVVEEKEEEAELAEEKTEIPIEYNPLDKVGDLFAGGTLKGTPAEDIYQSALAGNAQATKDLAWMLFNNIGCLGEDRALAIELYEQSAEAGNVQAKTDLAYIQYHGLAGVAQDTEAALKTMKEDDVLKIMESIDAQGPLDYWENPEPSLVDNLCGTEGDIIEPLASPVPTEIIEDVVIPPAPETDNVGCNFQPVITNLQKPIEFVCNMGPTHDIQVGDTFRINAYMHLDNDLSSGSDIHFIGQPTQVIQSSQPPALSH